jgi:hypothetical protein
MNNIKYAKFDNATYSTTTTTCCGQETHNGTYQNSSCNNGYINNIIVYYNNNSSHDTISGGVTGLTFNCTDDSQFSYGITNENAENTYAGVLSCADGFTNLNYNADSWIDTINNYSCMNQTTNNNSLNLNYGDSNNGGTAYNVGCSDSSKVINSVNVNYNKEKNVIDWLGFNSCIDPTIQQCSNFGNMLSNCNCNVEGALNSDCNSCANGANISKNCLCDDANADSTNCTSCKDNYIMCQNTQLCTPSICLNNQYANPCDCTTCMSNFSYPPYGEYEKTSCFANCPANYAMSFDGSCHLQCPLGTVPDDNEQSCIDYSPNANKYYKNYNCTNDDSIYVLENSTYTNLNDCYDNCLTNNMCIGFDTNIADATCTLLFSDNSVKCDGGGNIYTKKIYKSPFTQYTQTKNCHNSEKNNIISTHAHIENCHSLCKQDNMCAGFDAYEGQCNLLNNVDNMICNGGELYSKNNFAPFTQYTQTINCHNSETNNIIATHNNIDNCNSLCIQDNMCAGFDVYEGQCNLLNNVNDAICSNGGNLYSKTNYNPNFSNIFVQSFNCRNINQNNVIEPQLNNIDDSYKQCFQNKSCIGFVEKNGIYNLLNNVDNVDISCDPSKGTFYEKYDNKYLSSYFDPAQNVMNICKSDQIISTHNDMNLCVKDCINSQYPKTIPNLCFGIIKHNNGKCDVMNNATCIFDVYSGSDNDIFYAYIGPQEK